MPHTLPSDALPAVPDAHPIADILSVPSPFAASILPPIPNSGRSISLRDIQITHADEYKDTQRYHNSDINTASLIELSLLDSAQGDGLGQGYPKEDNNT
jgi:hypothetical protein